MIGSTLGSAPVGGEENTSSIYTESITESLTLDEYNVWGKYLVHVLNENIRFSESLSSDLSLNVIEDVAFLVTHELQTTYHYSVIDSATFTERLSIWLEAAITESMSLSTTVDERIHKAAAIVERLLLSGTVNSTWAAAMAVVESMALTDLLSPHKGAEAVESLALGDTLDAKINRATAILEALALSELVGDGLRLYATATENLALGENLDLSQVLSQAVTEKLVLTTTFRAGDAEFIGWVLNTHTTALTAYSNFPFTSFAVDDNGRQLATGPEGVYELTGDLDVDAPINAALRTGMAQLTPGRLTRIQAAYIGMTADGKVALRTIMGDGTERVYKGRIVRKGVYESRFQLGKAPRSFYWQFQIENIGGSDFDIDSLELYPITVERKV